MLSGSTGVGCTDRWCFFNGSHYRFGFAIATVMSLPYVLVDGYLFFQHDCVDEGGWQHEQVCYSNNNSSVETLCNRVLAARKRSNWASLHTDTPDVTEMCKIAGKYRSIVYCHTHTCVCAKGVNIIPGWLLGYFRANRSYYPRLPTWDVSRSGWRKTKPLLRCASV